MNEQEKNHEGMQKMEITPEKIRKISRKMLNLTKQKNWNIIEVYIATKHLEAGLEQAMPKLIQLKPQIEKQIQAMRKIATTTKNQEEEKPPKGVS